MKFETKGIKIIGMSATAPSKVVENMDAVVDDKKLKKLIKMTGIYRRHIIDSEAMSLVDLAITSAKDVISKSNVDKNRIKYIIYITQKPEFAGPATAFFVQKQLEIGTDCLVFDINLGCSGFMAGLQIMSSMLNNRENGDLGLLINAENMSGISRENQNDELLFGDAATAVLLEKDDRYSDVIKEWYFSDGNRYDAIIQRDPNGACYMDGQAVFEFSVYEVSKYITHFLQENGLSNDDIDYIAFHQAQKFIIDHIASNAKLDKKKMLYSLDEYGNTSGASIPLSICNSTNKIIGDGRYLLSGFGVGLAWGVAYIIIDKKAIFGINHI